MKSIEEFASENIQKIRVNSANLDHIKSTGIINGELSVDLTRLSKSMVEFACLWISIEEELPEQVHESGDSDQVLIKTERGYISTGIYDHSVNKWINDIPNRYFMSVAYWRPIERQ